ncbi:MAG: class II aldolase/adducin family protein, partial [Rhodospirillales bacterium]
MAPDASAANDANRPADISPEEWDVRVNLAAAYRLVDLFGWSDLLGTHLSARVPGPDEHFLINPFGVLFEEMTASALIKVDEHGTCLTNSEYSINPAAFVIHSAVHLAVPELSCVMHTHTRDGVGVACQEDGILPIS